MVFRRLCRRKGFSALPSLLLGLCLGYSGKGPAARAGPAGRGLLRGRPRRAYRNTGDKLYFNKGRDYGPARWPALTVNWGLDEGEAVANGSPHEAGVLVFCSRKRILVGGKRHGDALFESDLGNLSLGAT